MLSVSLVNRRFHVVGRQQKLSTHRILLATSRITEHVEEHKQFEKQKQKVVESKDKQPSMFFKGKQLTLEESKDRARVWDVNDPRAQLVHRRIAEMIALDCQPCPRKSRKSAIHQEQFQCTSVGPHKSLTSKNSCILHIIVFSMMYLSF